MAEDTIEVSLKALDQGIALATPLEEADPECPRCHGDGFVRKEVAAGIWHQFTCPCRERR